MGVDIPFVGRSANITTWAEKEKHADYWFGDPITGESAAYGDDDFHEGDPRKPDGYCGFGGEANCMLYFSVQWVAGLIFWFEVQIKWTGWGRKMYFKDYFNWLDVFLLGFWVMNTLMLVLFAGGSGEGIGSIKIAKALVAKSQIPEGPEVALSLRLLKCAKYIDPMYQIKHVPAGGSPT